MVESTRLESEHTGNRIVGSNPTLSAISHLSGAILIRESFSTRFHTFPSLPASKNPSRLIYGVESLPLGTPVELELIFEVA